MKLSVERNSTNDALGTEGTLFLDGVKFCFTLEPGRQDPTRPKGIVSPGLYNVFPMFSDHFGRLMPHISNQSDKRTLIDSKGVTWVNVMIHFGNYPKNTEGCLIVGQTQTDDFVGSSQTAFKDLLAQLYGQDQVFIEYIG